MRGEAEECARERRGAERSARHGEQWSSARRARQEAGRPELKRHRHASLREAASVAIVEPTTARSIVVNAWQHHPGEAAINAAEPDTPSARLRCRSVGFTCVSRFIDEVMTTRTRRRRWAASGWIQRRLRGTREQTTRSVEFRLPSGEAERRTPRGGCHERSTCQRGRERQRAVDHCGPASAAGCARAPRRRMARVVGAVRRQSANVSSASNL